MIKATEARFVQLGGLGTAGKGFAPRSESALWNCLIREAGSAASLNDILLSSIKWGQS